MTASFVDDGTITPSPLEDRMTMDSPLTPTETEMLQIMLQRVYEAVEERRYEDAAAVLAIYMTLRQVVRS